MVKLKKKVLAGILVSMIGCLFCNNLTLFAATKVNSRYAVMQNDGKLVSKDNDLSSAWITQIGGIEDYQIEGNRIVALYPDGKLIGTEGLGGSWVTLIGGIESFELEGNRIGAKSKDGKFIAKDGLYGTWVTLIGGIESFDLEGDRIAARYASGKLIAKDGMNGTWVTLIGGVESFELEGNRIAAKLKDGKLVAKDGMYGAWVTLIGGIESFDLEGDRIAAKYASGKLIAKDGMYGSWVTLIGGVKNYNLNGNRIIVILSTNDTAKLKDGMNGTWITMIQNAKNAQIATYEEQIASPVVPNPGNSLNELAEYAKSKVDNTGYKGRCLAFVSDCYQAVYGGTRSSACCAYKYGTLYIDSADKSNIPVGADVFFGGGASGKCGTCGSSTCGHVGIYIGDGKIVHSWGSKISITTIDYVINSGYTYRGWGWHANRF